MGVRLSAKGVDAEAYATEYGAPVRRGLEGIFFLNTSLEKCTHNYAPGKSSGVNSIVGTPTIGAGYLSCKSMTNFVQTDIRETEEMTMFVISRSPELPPGATSNPSAVQPLLIGNYGSVTAINTPGDNGSGCVMWTPSDTNCSGGGGYDSISDPNLNTNTQAALTGEDTKVWRIYAFRVAIGAVTAWNGTTGKTATTVIDAPRKRRLSKRTMRLASGYLATQTGAVDIAVAQIHNVALTDAEVTKTIANLKAYALRKGIIV